MQLLYAGSSIRTHSGIYLDVFRPTTEMINIEDIAHGLSFQPRFGGHLSQFYSVAQHSWFCYQLASPEHKLAALLHDASEGLGLCDLPKPIKNQIPQYAEIEDNLMRVVAEKFGFEYPLAPEIKEIDQIALVTEWDCLVKGSISVLVSMTPAEAKQKFLDAFYEVTEARKPETQPLFHFSKAA